MLCAAFLGTGCASLGAHSEGPRSDIYPGVRADAHSVTHPKAEDSAPVLSAIDLPFSFVWDTLCLPFFDGPAAIINACRSKSRRQDDKAVTLAAALPDLEQRVGQRVALEGVVSNTKCPQVQGVDAWGLEDYRGQHVRVTGVLRRSVVTQAEIDALKTPEGFPLVAHRGAGTFYSLEDMKYELLK
jgi:uncharacterized protein YceK